MDLQRAILKAIHDHEDKAVFGYLKHPTGAAFKWRTAPCVQWLAQAKPLILNYLKVAKKPSKSADDREQAEDQKDTVEH